jgi:circadian clock protein KaiB
LGSIFSMVRRKKMINQDESGSEFPAITIASAQKHYVLRLYVTGSTPHSTRAITNIRKLCEEYLEDCYDLEVVDMSQNPALAGGEQIIAAPTLIKKLPLPLRRFIGDMSNTERILIGLDLRELDETLSSGKHG